MSSRDENSCELENLVFDYAKLWRGALRSFIPSDENSSIRWLQADAIAKKIMAFDTTEIKQELDLELDDYMSDKRRIDFSGLYRYRLYAHLGATFSVSGNILKAKELYGKMGDLCREDGNSAVINHLSCLARSMIGKNNFKAFLVILPLAEFISIPLPYLPAISLTSSAAPSLAIDSKLLKLRCDAAEQWQSLPVKVKDALGADCGMQNLLGSLDLGQVDDSMLRGRLSKLFDKGSTPALPS